MASRKHIEVSLDELVHRIDDMQMAVSTGLSVHVRRDGKTLFILVDPVEFADLRQAEIALLWMTDQYALALGLTVEVSAAVDQSQSPAPIADARQPDVAVARACDA
jgi:hypothetical protein